MASPCQLTIDTRDERRARIAAREAVAEIRRIEAKFSRYRPDSIVSRINAAAGQSPVPVDRETDSLLDFADTLFRQSGGLFDITSGVLRRAWDFRRGVVPGAEELSNCCALIGWPRVQRDRGQIFLPAAGMEIDFGGFGKEYAADRAAATLRAHMVEHALVNLGGDLHALGPRGLPDCAGQPWRIEIAHPRPHSDVPRQTVATLELGRGGLATSGDYERYFERDGLRYCHILKPQSGWPVRHWQSVSVISVNTVSAGAASTIAMLKEENALPWLADQNLPYLAVRDEQRIFKSTLKR